MLSCLVWMQLTCLKFFLHSSMITPTRSGATDTCAWWYFRLTSKKLRLQVWCWYCLCICLFDRLSGWVDCLIRMFMRLRVPALKRQENWGWVTYLNKRPKVYRYVFDNLCQWCELVLYYLVYLTHYIFKLDVMFYLKCNNLHSLKIKHYTPVVLIIQMYNQWIII